MRVYLHSLHWEIQMSAACGAFICPLTWDTIRAELQAKGFPTVNSSQTVQQQQMYHEKCNQV